MKAPRIDPAVQELAVLSGLAALGCGLATAQGDLWFVAIFGAPRTSMTADVPAELAAYVAQGSGHAV